MSDELNGLRIRQLATMRRATYRSRSHALIAAVGCVIVSAQLIWMAIQARSIWSILYVGLACAGVWGAIRLFARAAALKREAEKSLLHDPGAPPDFSTLSDGSQVAKNLEKIEPD